MAFIPKNVIGRLNELSCESVAEKLGVEVIHHKALCIAHDEEHPSMAFFGENRSRGLISPLPSEVSSVFCAGWDRLARGLLLLWCFPIGGWKGAVKFL